MRHSPLVTSLCASLLLGLIAVGSMPTDAAAFCGFYVAGSNDDLYNDATQVALMREGTTTVLSMENNYRGPLEDFAMVIPVPQILMEADVKTLDPEIFRKLDKLTAPRLVQYWEKNPCEDNIWEDVTYINGCEYDYEDGCGGDSYCNGASNNYNNIYDMASSADQGGPPPVIIEAEFVVGEYEILVLSSEEATGLETWLTQNNYNIPQGATEIFEQYIQQGMYFFVAKVDPAKVTVTDGQAILSPLRFSYTSEEFSLPIRLGMVNSAGKQDLLVYTLAANQRYEVANYGNFFIPTNLNVTQDVKSDFPAFYEKVFSRELAKNPSAVATEYSWSAATCDPCPTPPMEQEELAALGADIIAEQDPYIYNAFTITRLHARYGKTDLSQDLIFKTADPAYGGRGTAGTNHQPTTVSPNNYADQFQGRYIIHNRYDGELSCDHKVPGRWVGPPPEGESFEPSVAPGPNTTGGVAEDSLGDKSLEQLMDTTVPETGEPKRVEKIVDQGVCMDPDAKNYMAPKEQIIDEDGEVMRNPELDEEESGRGCSSSAANSSGGAIALFVGALLLGMRRRRQRN